MATAFKSNIAIQLSSRLLRTQYAQVVFAIQGMPPFELTITDDMLIQTAFINSTSVLFQGKRPRPEGSGSEMPGHIIPTDGVYQQHSGYHVLGDAFAQLPLDICIRGDSKEHQPKLW